MITYSLTNRGWFPSAHRKPYEPTDAKTNKQTKSLQKMTLLFGLSIGKSLLVLSCPSEL